jgi:tRNA nucleotidyltransferase (CCA-adding enzyme)
MHMRRNIEGICRAVLQRVTPDKREREKIESLSRDLKRRVSSASAEFGVETKVRVEGSVAKDTWLSREPDIDVFMRVPASIPRKSLGEVSLQIARKATEGSEQIERFAEHPYLEANVDETRVNIVPCYDVKPGEWLSATDRTPFHTDYVRKNLNDRLRGEVRLLKKYMKGIGVYGAEIKVGGFSGYLCELLTIHHKSFRNTLEAFAEHKERTVIDIANHYSGRERELRLLFKEPLVVIDPVDKGRNVASAVQQQKLDTFEAASRAFIKNPSLDFFYPPPTSKLSLKELKRKLENHGSSILFLVFGKVNAVPDVLWGQLYKSQRSLRKLIQLNDFNVLRDAAWSDEKHLNVFIFELEQRTISPVKRHVGPPLERKQECEKFLAKHLNGSGTLVGPYVDGGRWVVQIRRKYVDAVDLLSESLKNGGKGSGVAEKLSESIRRGFRVLADDEISKVYSENDVFAEFLTQFIAGKPRWLESVKAEN